MSGTMRLALSASFGTASCALQRDGETFGPQRAAGGGTDLAAAVGELFRRAGVDPQQLTAILLDVGPGSYTGLRVAVTWASFCRRYLGAEVHTVTSLELMVVAAWRAGIIPAGADTRAVLDARRQRYHHALVGLSSGPGPCAQLLEPPRATSLDELVAGIGNEQLLSAVDLRASLDAAVAVRIQVPTAHDAGLLFDPLLAPRPAGEELEPLYLMGSYAEQPEG